ncbi:hypothetical protein SAMN04487911_1171, partial [Arenibacter nanhaiticus]
NQNISSAVVTANESVNIALERGGNTTIDFRDADADPTNELITSANLTGTNLNIIDAGGTTTVDLSSLNDSGTDDQVISTTGAAGNITIENGNTLVLNVNDADSDPTNEIQNVASADASVTVTRTVNDFDLSVNFPANNDNSSTNELTDLNLAANILNLTNPATGGNQVDLSGYMDNTDEQTLSIAGDQLSITGGNTVTVPTADGTETIMTAGNDISVTGDGSSANPYVVNNVRPNIFYPPSIAVDASSTGTGRTINLHSQYIAQFGSPMVSSNLAPAAIPTYANTDLYYYVTYYDNTVFANVSVDEFGVMTYDVIASPTDYNSLINVVFVVK